MSVSIGNMTSVHIQSLKDWKNLTARIVNSIPKYKQLGEVIEVSGILIEGKLNDTKIGDLCLLYQNEDEQTKILTEVVGFRENNILLSALTSTNGVSYRMKIQPLYSNHRMKVSEKLLGQVLNGFGQKMAKSKAEAFNLHTLNTYDPQQIPVVAEAPDPIKKPRIDTKMTTGIRAIDSLLTIGVGQRVGLFAGAGCGKTTLLTSIARGCDADIVILALIGERGRELNEFLDHEFDEILLKKMIVVCATSDRTSMERSRAAFTATAIAEGFRNQGKKVLLLIDSLTRFARAQREIGLAAGEPPAKGGFPPSTYAMLPKLIERAGNSEIGSITAIYTVLIEGDSMMDPIADESRSLLDGHIILSRKLAEKGQYPAIDILASLSRIMTNIISQEKILLANKARQLLSTYKELELMIRLGEYEQGKDPVADEAVTLNPQIIDFLKQDTREENDFSQSWMHLANVLNMEINHEN